RLVSHPRPDRTTRAGQRPAQLLEERPAMILLMLLFSAAPPPTKAPKPVLPAFDLRDKAGLFSKKEAAETEERLKAFQKKDEDRSLPRVVETVKAQSFLQGTDEQAREEALRKWLDAKSKADKPVSPCLYILVSKEPPDVQALAWPSLAEVNARIRP